MPATQTHHQTLIHQLVSGDTWPGQTWQIPVPITIEEYRNNIFRPDCDFVDGFLVHRRPPEGKYTEQEIKELFVGEWEHNKLQLLMGNWFLSHEAVWPIDVVPEQRIQVAPKRIRVCDVCLLHRDAPRERTILTAPLLCIEILSPADRKSRAKLVLEDYRRMGVPNTWLIDPIRRKAWIYHSLELHEVPTDRIAIPDSPIHLMLDDLLDRLT